MGKAYLVAECEQIFEDMVSVYGLRPSQITYNTLLQVYGKMGHVTKAMALFRRMLEDGQRPDEYTGVSLLLAHSSSNAPAADAARLWRELTDVHGIRPNTQLLTALLNAYRAARDLDPRQKLDRALEILQGMEGSRGGRRARPSVQTYNSVLKACEEANDPDAAQALFDRMLDLEVEPSDVTYAIMGRFMSQAGRLDSVHRIRDFRKVAGLTSRP